MFYEVQRAPASSQLLFATRAEAIALPRGRIELALCGACGFMFNAAFDVGMATCPAGPDEDRSFATFKAFEHSLAERLVSRFALRDKHILEIGSGGGDLLDLLCRLGDNRGARLGPGYLAAPGDSALERRATVGRERFAEQPVSEPIDLICTRMVLERIPNPVRFVRVLRRAVSHHRQGRLLLQVPDVVRTLRDSTFWEIHYEHCSYFSPGALQRLLSAQGFTVSDMWTELDGQLLMAYARVGADGPPAAYAGELLEAVAGLQELVARFTLECREKQALWCEILHRMASAGNRIMVWGAGPRTVSFLTTLAVGDEVGWVVDPDPGRQGKYLAGTGHLIVGPRGVAALQPEMVIITNWIYTSEIQELLRSVGCTPTLLIP